MNKLIHNERLNKNVNISGIDKLKACQMAGMAIVSEPIVLSTFGTGIGLDHQLVEIGIRLDSENHYHNRFLPTVEISEASIKAHGLDRKRLERYNNSAYTEEHSFIKTLLGGQMIVAYGASHEHLLRQTCEAFSLNTEWIDYCIWVCAHQIARLFFGDTYEHGITLEDALLLADIKIEGSLNESIDVAEAVRQLMVFIYNQLEVRHALSKIKI